MITANNINNFAIENSQEDNLINSEVSIVQEDKKIEETATIFASTKQYQRNLAATKIQKIYRKYVAAKSYKYMFEGGEDFKKYKELKPSPSNTLGYLTKLQDLSTRFINEIKEQLGELTTQEKNFVSEMSLINNFTLKHQTQYQLHQEDKQQKQKLTLFSSLYLDQHNIKVKRHTYDCDIEMLNNQDFIFFSIDFSGSDLSCKPLGMFLGVIDYGYRAYIIKQAKENFNYFTLTDHFYNFVYASQSNINKYFYDKFPQVLAQVKRLLYGKLGQRDIPIFTQKDISSALAYHCIEFVRQCEDKCFSNYVYGNLNLKEIDTLFNSIFNPEAHIPRLLITDEFAEHILREPDLYEIYNSGNISKIFDFCFAEYNKNIQLNLPVRESLLDTASFLDEIIKKSIEDGNAEILKIAIQKMEQLDKLGVTHVCCIKEHILSYKIQLAIIENNTEDLAIYLTDLRAGCCLPYGVIKLLLNRDDCCHHANLILNSFNAKKNNPQQAVRLMVDEKDDLYILTERFKELPFNPNKDISSEISLLFDKRINLFKYVNNQSKYINYIAYSLMQYKPSLTAFINRISLYVSKKQNENLISIDEDIIFLMLNNYYLTEQSCNTLKNAFIESGMLVPSKQIEASFYINNNLDYSNLNNTTDVNNFIKRKDSLQNYAVNRYNIDLLPQDSGFHL